MGNDHRINIGINADANVADAVAGAITALEGLKAALNDVDGSKATITAEAKTADALAEVKKTDAEITALFAKAKEVKVSADVAKAETELKKVERELHNIDGMRANAKADLDTGDFVAEAKVLKRELDSIDRRVVKAMVEMDSGEAIAELAALRASIRDEKMTIEVDVDAATAVAELGAITTAMSTLRSVIPGLVSAVSAGRAAVIALAVAVVGSLIPALGPAAGALGILGFAAGSAAGAIGLLVGAFAPTISAFSKMKQNAQEQETAMKAVETATEGVSSAQDSLKDATRSAAENVRSANEAYKSSLDDVRDARAAVTDAEQEGAKQIKAAVDGVSEARQQAAADTRAANAEVASAEDSLGDARDTLTNATQDLESAQQDLNVALRDEPLNQKEATLDLADARDRASDATDDYNEAVKKYGRNSEEATDALRDMQRAELDLKRTQGEVNDIRKNGSEELQSAKEAAQQAGDAQVDAADGVKAAEKSLAQARKDAARTATEGQQNIKAAQKEVVAAQKEAAESVKDAQAGVRDALKKSQEAQKDVARTQKESARDVAKAQKDVAKAMEELADAQREAKNTGNSLTKTQQDLWDAFQKTKRNASNLFKPANDEMNRFGQDVLEVANKFLPSLAREAKESADALRGAFKNVVDDTNTKEIKSYKTVLDSFSPITRDLTFAMGDLGKALMNIWADATPDIKEFFGYVRNLMRDFKEYTETAKGQKEINQFLDNAVVIGQALWKAVGRIADAFYDVGRNKETMKGIADVIDGIAKAVSWTIRVLGDFAERWDDVRNGLRRFDDAMKAIFRLIGDLFTGNLKDASKQLGIFWDAIKDVGKAIFDFFRGQETSNLSEKFADAFKAVIKYLKGGFIDDLKEWGVDVLDWILHPFTKAYDKLVGNSIIPDLRKDMVSVFKGMGEDIRGILGDLGDAVGNRFSDMAEGASNKMKDLRTWAGNAAKGTKEDVGDFFRDMFDNSENIHKNMRDDSKSKFTTLKETASDLASDLGKSVGDSFHDMKKKAIDEYMENFKDDGITKSKDTKKGMEPPIKAMAENARSYLNALLDGMQKVNENADLGLKKINTFNPAVGASDNPDTKTVETYAAGGVVRGDSPVFMVGDQQQREYVINPSRDDNLPHLRAAAAEMGQVVVPNKTPQNGHDMAFVQNAQMGTDTSGATSYNWVPWVADIAKQTREAVGGITTNTYANHGGRGYWGEQHSVDHWGPGGRGDPVGTDKGNAATAYTLSNFGDKIMYYIWQGIIHGWGTAKPYSDPNDQHFDHLHTTYSETGSEGGLGAAGSYGIDIQPFIDKYIPDPWQAGDIGPYDLGDKEGIAGLARMKVLAKLFQKAGMAGGSFGNSPAGLTIGDVVNQTWPEGERSQAAAIIWRESNGNASAMNLWDSNAAAGTPSVGLMQIIEPTAQSVDKSATTDKLKDPLYNSHIGSLVQNAQGWSPWTTSAGWQGYTGHENEKITGYTHGGVALKPQISAVAEHGPEMFMPLHDRDSVRRFVEQLTDWRETQRSQADAYKVRNVVREQHDIDTISQTVRGRGAGQGHDHTAREIRHLGDRLEKSISNKVDARIENIEELAAAMIAGARADAAGPFGRQNWMGHQERQLKKLLDKKGGKR